jgi:chromosome segregation ATPase
LKCSRSAFELSQKELEDLNVRLANAVEEMQTLQKSNQELEQSLQETGLKLKAEIEASQHLKQLLEQEKYFGYEGLRIKANIFDYRKEAEDLKQTLESVSSSSASETGQLSSKLGDLSRSLASVKNQLQQKLEIISNLSTEVTKNYFFSLI